MEAKIRLKYGQKQKQHPHQTLLVGVIKQHRQRQEDHKNNNSIFFVQKHVNAKRIFWLKQQQQQQQQRNVHTNVDLVGFKMPTSSVFKLTTAPVVWNFQMRMPIMLHYFVLMMILCSLVEDVVDFPFISITTHDYFVEGISVPPSFPLHCVIPFRKKKQHWQQQKQQQRFPSSSHFHHFEDEEDDTEDYYNIVRGGSSAALSVETKDAGIVASTTTTINQDDTNKNKNVVFQLINYLKNSIQQTVTATTDLYKNHQTCNTIRQKQKVYRANMERTVTADGTTADSYYVDGGISYEEYIFLLNGKVDRGKVFNLLFLMWGAPKFLPYALMFNKEMLPSPFRTLQQTPSSTHSIMLSKGRTLQRECTYLLFNTFLEMERQVSVQQDQDLYGSTTGSGGTVNPLSFLGSLFGNKKKVEEQHNLLNTIQTKAEQLLREAVSSSAASLSLASSSSPSSSSSLTATIPVSSSNLNTKQHHVNQNQPTLYDPTSVLTALAPFLYKITSKEDDDNKNDAQSSKNCKKRNTKKVSTKNRNKNNNNNLIGDFTREQKKLCTEMSS